MSRLRKNMILAIATSLALSTASFGAPAPTAAAQLAKQIPTIQLQKPAVKIPARLVSPENPDEKVRIIVELEKAPAIETATKKGVLYKELSPSQRNSLESSIETDQVNVQASIKKIAKNFTLKENFTTVFNGFSAEVDARDVAKIANTLGVKAVYESTEYSRPTEKPEMTHSKELVQAQLAWDKYNFKGEGMVVGIIDTGIDPSHRDMILTDNSTGDITSDEVGTLVGNGSIEAGKYFTAKVPYGYNYMDRNQEIRDLGPGASMHGMHVGGTVGANGDEENGGIQGVAPEAQLLALKVFGNDPLFPSTFGDIYVKAMDDAIKLGADVINMSLGSTAGYVDNSNPEQMAVTRAQDNGLLVAISAGNSDMFGSGTWYPYADNQDYGLTGSPSVSEDSFGVASFENSHVTASSFTYEFDGVQTGRAMFLLANDVEPNDLPLEEYPIEFAGFGAPSDFEGKDFTGKFALVSRGNGINFVDKGLNAQAAGAVGVIVYNNVAGTISMASSSDIKIPYMSALQVDGVALKTAIEAGKVVTVGFDGNYIEVPSPTAGKMSSFTSWGPTPNLDFKPEITAPGGNIFSTFNNNQYGLMSGTSMAAPHVAGGTALVMERVNEQFGLTGAARVKFAKNLMMNTAKPIELKPGQFVSPRRQGAGIMQLANALETEVMITNAATGEAKVALREIKDGKFSFSLKAKNYSWKAKEYNVKVQLQTDMPINAGPNFVTIPNDARYGSYVLDELDATISVPAKVTIPANGEATIDVSVDASESEWLKAYFANGYFIDGFVSLTDPNEETTGNVPLSVPFFGFNGSWDDAPIFDDNAWDELTYWGYQGLVDQNGNYIAGPSFGENFDPEKFAFSPNGDGNVDTTTPVFSLLRNAKKLEVNVLDANGMKVRTIRTDSNLTKNYADTATNPGYKYNPANGWDGKINGKIAKDGQYQIELRAMIDFEGAEWQTVKFPIIVDTQAPTADITFNAETKEVVLENVKDNTGGVGIDRVEVLVNGELVSVEAMLDSYILTDGLKTKDVVTVKVWDIAGNVTEKDFSLPNPTEENKPVILIATPEFFGYENSSDVLVAGTVEDESNVVSVKVNDVDAEYFDGTTFSHVYTYEEDGVHNVKVEAIDEHGNGIDISRRIFVDTHAPTIGVNTETLPSVVEMDEPNPSVNVTFGDNFDEVRLYVNGDEKFAKSISEPYQMLGFEKTMSLELPLEPGLNEFEFKVVDLVGHETVQTISILKQGIAIDSPDIFNTKDVTISGKILNNARINSVTVNDVEADLNGIDFSSHLTFEEDGVHDVKVEATYGEGGKISRVKKVMVDTTAPTIELTPSTFEPTGSVELFVDVNIGDNFDGMKLYLGDEEVFSNTISEPFVMSEYSEKVPVKLSLVNGENTFNFKVVDAAGNESTKSITIVKEDVLNPSVTITTPEDFAYEKTNKVIVSGSVEDDTEVVSVNVNDHEATLTEGEFSHELDLADGLHEINVKAIDASDNWTIETQHVVVDTTVPTIAATAKTSTTSSTETIKVTLGDNFNAYTLFLDGQKINEKVIAEKTNPELYGLDEYSFTVDVPVSLVKGDNDFVLKVVDLSGNEAVKNITIKKSDVVVTNPNPNPTLPPVVPPVVTPPTPGEVIVGEIETTKQANDPLIKEVKVELPALTEKLSEASAKIPSGSLKAVAQSSKPLIITSGDAQVTVPNEVLKAIAAGSPDSATVSVKMSKSTDVNGAVSSTFEFTISTVKDGKTTDVTTFTEPVQLTVPVSATVKDSRKVAAYYVNETTNKLAYVGGIYGDGKLVFKTNHFSKFVVVENNKTFQDIQKHWAKDQIEVLASRSITSGKTETSFNPEGKITRAEFAVLVSRALNLPVEEYKGTFKDINDKAWSYEGIEAAYRAGIIMGRTNGSFDPGALITREEMAAIIVRAIKYQDESLLENVDSSKTFADNREIGSFARDAVNQAVGLGIFAGRSGNKFDPKTTATRAETAVILYRALDKLKEF